MPKQAIAAVAMKDEIPLGTVNEENEDDLEQSTNKLLSVVDSHNDGLLAPISPAHLQSTGKKSSLQNDYDN